MSKPFLMHILISSQKLVWDNKHITILQLQFHLWPHSGPRLQSCPNMCLFIGDVCKAWLASRSSTTFLQSCQQLLLLCQHQHPPFPLTRSLHPLYTLSFSVFLNQSFFSVDLWFDNIQLQNLMKCRWKEMCSSKNITVKIKTRQQKLSKQNYSSL